MQTKYSHLTDSELLALRYSTQPLDESPLIAELFNRLQEKIVDAPDVRVQSIYKQEAA